MNDKGSVLSSEVAARLLSLEIRENFTDITRINRVCVVGVARTNTEVTNLLKNHFGIELLESEDGYEFTKDANITFLCSEFTDCRWFKYLNSFGNQLLAQQLSGNPFLVPRPNRPLYTDSMSGVRIALSGFSIKNCREAVDLLLILYISWVQRLFSASTTYLITDAARMAVSVGCRVMHLDWLRAAWAARNSIQISVTTIDFYFELFQMNKYMAEPFCGLLLWFVAYDEKDLTDIEEKTVENNMFFDCIEAAFCPFFQATHIVVSTSLNAKVEGCDAKQHLVSGEWFWISVQLNCCANETHNSTLSPNTAELANRARKSVSKSFMEVLNSSNCSALLDSEILNGSPRKLNKRYAVCKEMLETKENYLRALKIVVQVSILQLLNLNSGLLTKAEISQVFAKIPPPIDVHENICCTHQSYIMHWMNERLIGKCQRNNLPDLLTDRKNPDNTYLIKAKRAMEAALTESRRQTDSYAMIFKLSSEVERCPDEWVKIRNKRMPIFLFNDLIEINVRTGNDDSSTPTRRSFSNYSFTRQLSLSALWYGKKNSSIYLLPFVEYKVFTLLENQEGKLEKFLREVADQVKSSLDVKENIATIKKALNHAIRNPFGEYQSLGIPAQSQFKRAMSTMHLSMSNTLSRLHSRSNLHPVDESFERTSPDGKTHTAGFTIPTRSFRQMLSTSTFLPSLGRRDSIFSHSIKE
uniref:DH domain-containing protein n=1 Tax=Wuchereria bancrofti TaxID=6293 RepID=A0AAF5Q5J5_WUCBA